MNKLFASGLAVLAAATLSACGPADKAPDQVAAPSPTPTPTASTSAASKVDVVTGKTAAAIDLVATFCPGRGADITTDVLSNGDPESGIVAAAQCDVKGFPVAYFQHETKDQAETFAMSAFISGGVEADYFGNVSAIFESESIDGDVADAIRNVPNYKKA